MITILKVILGFLLLCAIPGTIMGLISSYRAGQKPHEEVYLRLKKFAQWEKWPVIWRHTKTYYAYYGLAIILLASAFG
tara:strand:+ start:756 stop:989 length:234 start_codon:yes stop_codon:yes gene_type:complete